MKKEKVFMEGYKGFNKDLKCRDKQYYENSIADEDEAIICNSENNNDDSAQIGSSGNSAQIGSSGNSAQIGSSGDSAQINSTGKYSVIMCAGYNSKAKGKIGSWITLAEWENGTGIWKPKCVKTEYIDGTKIKEDTWYILKNGEFVEYE